MEDFCAAPFEVQEALFPCPAANVTTLDGMMGPMSVPGVAAVTASAATADAKQRHCELLEEVRHGNAGQADLLLRQTACQLAQGFCLLGIALLSVTPVTGPAVAAAGREPSAVVPPTHGPVDASNNDNSDHEADRDDDDDNEESGNDSGVEDDEV